MLTKIGNIHHVKSLLRNLGFSHEEFGDTLELNNDLFMVYDEHFQHWKIILEKNGFSCIHLVYTDLDAIKTITGIWFDIWGEEELRADSYMDEAELN